MGQPLVSQFQRSVTRAAGAWPVDGGAQSQLPVGVGLASVAFNVASTNFNGGTITGKLQGSIDGQRWEDIPEATSGAQGTQTAVGAAIFGGGADKLFDVSPYQFIRLVGSEAGGAPVDGSSVTAVFLAYYNQ